MTDLSDVRRLRTLMRKYDAIHHAARWLFFICYLEAVVIVLLVLS